MSDFHGLPTRILSSSFLRLEVLADAGPRIVRLALAARPELNLLAEVPDLGWPTPFGPFRPHGGHRLWHAPEIEPRTYVPDDAGLEIVALDGGLELHGPVEAPTGILKSLSVELDPDRAALRLTHRLVNHGPWPVDLAPWAITQLPLGGAILLPQQQGPAVSPLLPNRQLVLWPYTSWSDPRLSLQDDFVVLQAAPRLPPCKIGCFNRRGWAAYWREDVLLVKRFRPEPERPHVDLGCNVETYCNDRFVELETLGPLSRLEPGGSVTHVERWELYAVQPRTPELAGLRTQLAELAPAWESRPESDML